MLKRIVSVALLIVLASATAASGEDGGDGEREYRFLHGVISSYGSSSITVNERERVNINHDTLFYDSTGNASSFYKIGEHKWLYVEGAPESDGSINAERIYFLPGYIKKKERAGYGFMQLP